MFSSKTLISLDILDDMGVSKLSAKTFFQSELLLYHENDHFMHKHSHHVKTLSY